MKLHELRAVPGAKKAPKRKGRGTATGQGKTAGRGMNGQNSRSGGGPRPGFEGGQMPLYRRIPKRGVTNIKILGNGELEKNITIQAHKFSKSAIEKIESAGGKAEVI